MEEARPCTSSAKRGLALSCALLFFNLVFEVNAERMCTRQPLSQAFVAAENRALKHVAICSGGVGSRVSCVSKCHSLPACKSVNYNQHSRVCDFNNATRIDESNSFAAAYGSLYFDGNSENPEYSLAVYSDCQSLQKAGYSVSGIYTIFPVGFSDGLRVYCDMETDCGGWLVFQRRQDGSVDFYRDWVDYRMGFGDLAGEFWLGNDNLRALSNSAGFWDLRIDLEDWDGNTAWTKYEGFRISGEDYRLSFDSYNADSTAENSFTNQNHNPFTTKDRDNDIVADVNCAEENHGAWWYNRCSTANLNGMYFNSSREVKGDRRIISWNSWKGRIYSLKSCSMKIRQATNDDI